MTTYADFYQRSITDRDAFWKEQAALIEWKTEPRQVCDYSQPDQGLPSEWRKH